MIRASLHVLNKMRNARAGRRRRSGVGAELQMACFAVAERVKRGSQAGSNEKGIGAVVAAVSFAVKGVERFGIERKEGGARTKPEMSGVVRNRKEACEKRNGRVVVEQKK